MLVDIPEHYLGVLKRDMDPTMALIAQVISGDSTIEHVGPGCYRLGHWNFNHVIAPVVVNEYPFTAGGGHPPNPYGVCDSPEQFLAKYPALATDPTPYVVAFVRLRRDEQPDSGGWRWHKWGPYVGEQVGEREYLHDEPVIEEVYTYHMYEVDLSLVGA